MSPAGSLERFYARPFERWFGQVATKIAPSHATVYGAHIIDFLRDLEFMSPSCPLHGLADTYYLDLSFSDQ